MLHGLGPVHISAHTVVAMDGSRVAQTLDSLWFYTNIFASTHHHPLTPFTHQFSPSINAQESPHRDFQKPFTSFLVNQQDQHRKVETLTPECDEFGGIISSETGRERNKRERRKRRKLGNNVVDERVDLWFDKLEEESLKHHEMLHIQHQTKMPPLDDAVAMKKHLKSWAYAVAVSALSDEITL
ncbi:hypothetical protein DEO72_LG2g4843 [Vigna unguiculata]|uniref:Uncharacterized protein n=1 Tax=Vigna unguiculata TaxID=3917 RepID=A0A4D6L7J4_VIGUN|nr:hypothetical protein DEO72_LG2g4843 [Vigna unguiculata]